MSEIKTEIKRNADGSYTITDAHSTADILRWLLTQDDKDTVLYLLGGAQPKQEPDDLTIAYMSGFHDGKKKREWVGLTDEERKEIHDKWRHKACLKAWGYEEAIEAKLKEKNT